MRKGHQAQTSSEKLPSLLLLASAPYFATILCAPIGQYSLHWQVMRLIKWQYTIIQQASRCNRILVTYNLQ